MLKRINSAIVILTMLCLSGCSNTNNNITETSSVIESTEEETMKILDTSQEIEEQKESEVAGEYVRSEDTTKSKKENVYNWIGLKDFLSTEDYVTVEQFLPVLQEKANVNWLYEENEVLECSLDDFIVYLDNVMYEAEYEVDELINPSVACCDMDSDTNKELIIEIDNCAGQYIILFNIDNNYYGTVKSVRQFEELYENGLYYVSGGGWSAYCKMKLEEGILKDEKIALVDYEEKAAYYIEDTPVSEEDFYKWEHKNTMNRISFVKVKSDL